MVHKCYSRCMTTVGIRELRQEASDLVRRAEAGEDITITVSGRPSVRLVGIANTPNYWHSWDEIKDIWQTPAWDRDNWQADRDALDDFLDDSLDDPWERAARRTD